MKKIFKSKIALFMVSTILGACAAQGTFANPLHDAVLSGNSAEVTNLSDQNHRWVDERESGFAHVVPKGGSAAEYQLEWGQLTPLEVAAYRGDVSAVGILLRHFDNENNKADIKTHLLNIAVLCDNVIMADYLIRSGANVNLMPQITGRPQNLAYAPLHLAAYNGNVNMIDFLISRGADVNILTAYGETPLHRAVAGANHYSRMINMDSSSRNWESYNKCKDAILHLVKNHADTNITDRDGKTAADKAEFTLIGFNGVKNLVGFVFSLWK